LQCEKYKVRYFEAPLVFINDFPRHSHRIDIGQKVHSRVKSVPECQPTSGVAAMLKATKPEEIL
jgi:hypothetical protein